MAASFTAPGILASPDLLDTLRARKAQARALKAAYAPAPMAQDTMLYWLARAAKEAREASGRKQVHVAAEADKDQSSVYRFEQGEAWPRETDLMVAAYAQDLEISTIELWEAALSMWKEHGAQEATVIDLASRQASRSKARAESELDEDLDSEAQRSRGQGANGARSGNARRRKAR